MRTQHNSTFAASATVGGRRLKGGIALGLLLSLCAIAPWSRAEEAGVTDKTIRIGATIPLEGDYNVYGPVGETRDGCGAGWPNGAETRHRVCRNQ